MTRPKFGYATTFLMLNAEDKIIRKIDEKIRTEQEPKKRRYYGNTFSPNPLTKELLKWQKS
jgi:hypothetical protein